MVPRRQRIEFVVQAVDVKDDAPVWLTVDQRWARATDPADPTTPPAEAAEFRFYRSPTPRERDSLVERMHNIAGGLRPFNDLDQAFKRCGVRLREALEAELWPTGRPEAKLASERRRLDEEFGEAWARDTSEQKQLWSHLAERVGRIEWMAKWNVLAIGVHKPTDPPVAPGAYVFPLGWESIADVEIDEFTVEAIYQAWNLAYGAATAGK